MRVLVISLLCSWAVAGWAYFLPPTLYYQVQCLGEPFNTVKIDAFFGSYGGFQVEELWEQHQIQMVWHENSLRDVTCTLHGRDIRVVGTLVKGDHRRGESHQLRLSIWDEEHLVVDELDFLMHRKVQRVPEDNPFQNQQTVDIKQIKYGTSEYGLGGIIITGHDRIGSHQYGHTGADFSIRKVMPANDPSARHTITNEDIPWPEPIIF